MGGDKPFLRYFRTVTEDLVSLGINVVQPQGSSDVALLTSSPSLWYYRKACGPIARSFAEVYARTESHKAEYHFPQYGRLGFKVVLARSSADI